MSRTLIGQPSQFYETLQGGKYQATSAGEIDSVEDHHVADLVKAGCVDRDIAVQGALAGINALSGDGTKFVAGDGTLKKPVGLPAGGTPGQVVTKTMSGADWETPPIVPPTVTYTGYISDPGLFSPSYPGYLSDGSFVSASGCWVTIFGSPVTEASLVTLSSPNIAAIKGSGTATLSLSFSALTSLQLPALVTLVNGLVGAMNGLTTLDFSALTEVLSGGYLVDMNALTSASFPSLASVNGGFSPGLPMATTLSVPTLRTVTSDRINSAGINPNFGALPTFSLPALISTQGGVGSAAFAVFGAATLTTVTMPVIQAIDGNGSAAIDMSDASLTALTTFTLGSTLKKVVGDVLFPTSALNQASVDNILVRLAALNGSGGTTSYDNNTVTITGTSASPSGTGTAAAATLTGRGNTVMTN